MLNRAIVCLAVMTALLSFDLQCAACSMAGCFNDGDEMRPTFTIWVTHGDKPLAGVAFDIVSKGAKQYSGTTDENGIVRIQTLTPGLYWLSGDFLGTGVAYTCFHVSGKPSKKAKKQLTYTWGDDAPATSRIDGRLTNSQPAKGGTPIWNLTHRVDVPITGANLTLRDPSTHAVYSTTSDEGGHFSFEGLPNGTYVLHVEGGDYTYDPSDSVVALSSTAKPSHLLFKGGPTGCGGDGLSMDLFE